MNKWESQSNRGNQLVLSLVCVVIGVVLAVGFRHFHGPGMSNTLAGFLLGLLLLLIGLSALVMNGQQTVVVDPAVRAITVRESNIFKTTMRAIPFHDIVDVHIGYLGKRSNYVNFYYLILKLRSGEEYSLFPPGYCYAGASDRSVVESWQQRLETYLRQ